MSTETPTPQPEVTTSPDKGPVDPLQFLTNAGGPSKAQVDAWKAQTCNGRVKLFTPDGTLNRVFILRGLSARELEAVRGELPVNVSPERAPLEMQRLVVIRGTLWTNINKTNKLDTEALTASGAGLIESLYALISDLSDFLDPVMLEKLSADL
jgi:hypothetical protein